MNKEDTMRQRNNEGSMKSARFDTLQYAKKAKEAGFTEQQAEFQAEALEALAEILDKGLATKNDITDLKKDIKNDITDLKKDTEVFRIDFKKDIAVLKKDIEVLRTDVKKDIGILDARITAVDSKLTWLISLFGVVSILIGIANF